VGGGGGGGGGVKLVSCTVFHSKKGLKNRFRAIEFWADDYDPMHWKKLWGRILQEKRMPMWFQCFKEITIAPVSHKFVFIRILFSDTVQQILITLSSARRWRICSGVPIKYFGLSHYGRRKDNLKFLHFKQKGALGMQ
jgi:hypothetical protein